MDPAGELAQLLDRDLELRCGLVRRSDRLGVCAGLAASRAEAGAAPARPRRAAAGRRRAGRAPAGAARRRLPRRSSPASGGPRPRRLARSVKSRTIAVTSSGPLGATRASSSRVPPGRSSEKSNAWRPPVSRASAVAASAAVAGRRRTSPRGAAGPTGTAPTSTFGSSAARVGEVVAIGDRSGPSGRGSRRRARAAGVRSGGRSRSAAQPGSPPAQGRGPRSGPAPTSSGTSAMRRTRLMISDRQEDQPGDEDRQQLPPRARGRDQPASDDHDRRHRRQRQAAVEPGRARIEREQRRGEEEVEAGRADGQDRDRSAVDARCQPAARVGEHQGERAGR